MWFSKIGVVLGLSKILAHVPNQSSVVVKHPHRNDKDVGSNPTTTRNGKQTLGGPPYRR